MQYVLCITDTGNNLSAWFPDAPGCFTTGESLEEILASAAEGLPLHLQDDPLPPARPVGQIAASGEADPSAVYARIEVIRQEHEPAAV